MTLFSIVVFDGTSHFVESTRYSLARGEKVVYKGSFKQCDAEAERLNRLSADKRRK